MTERWAALEAEAVRLARGPAIAKAAPTEREVDASLARQRLLRLLEDSGLSVNAFAELIGCDEKALRLVRKGEGLAVPWWLERLLRERPEFVAEFAAGLIADARQALASKERASNG